LKESWLHPDRCSEVDELLLDGCLAEADQLLA
jgi:hypothetical protein